MKYKGGTAIIKVDRYGNWLNTDSANYYRILKHIFVSYSLDYNNTYISFFTSQSEITLANGQKIKNIACESVFSELKYVNKAMLLNSYYLRNFVDLNYNFDDVMGVLKLHNINNPQKLGIIREMVINFKKSLDILPNEKAYDILWFERVGNKLKLHVIFKANIMVIDENAKAYNGRTVEIALNSTIKVDRADLTVFLNSEESTVVGINELVDLFNG